jgi:alpha-tubulin suppressor-like RCC1 family protein
MRALFRCRNWQNFFFGFLMAAAGADPLNGAAPSIRIERSGGALQIHFNGALESSSRIEGPYRRLPDAVNPWTTTADGAALFWRASLPGLSTIAAGHSHTVALRSDGSLWTWGTNSFGQLGQGATLSASEPKRVGNENSWLGVAAGDYFTIALRVDGTLWAWGDNYIGQLGQGTFGGHASTPLQIGTNANWQTMSAGRDHVVALREDETLWAWGGNPEGQLGNGSYASVFQPQAVQPEHRWRSAAAGYAHTVTVRADGTLWTWGDNTEGQMGNGTWTSDFSHGITTPQQVGTETNWAAVSARGKRTLASRNNGTLWAWGENYAGQGGTGATGRTLRPEPVSSDLQWHTFAAGGRHTAAISDGKLWAWGSNQYGQTGTSTNTTVVVTTPQAVAGTATWSEVAAGFEHTAALRSDGTLWAWGRNDAGQLGDGTSTNRLSPVQIPGGTAWGPSGH